MKRYTKVMIAAMEGSTISGGRNLWIENGFRGRCWFTSVTAIVSAMDDSAMI
jgi:hypothetical protein